MNWNSIADVVVRNETIELNGHDSAVEIDTSIYLLIIHPTIYLEYLTTEYLILPKTRNLATYTPKHIPFHNEYIVTNPPHHLWSESMQRVLTTRQSFPDSE